MDATLVCPFIEGYDPTWDMNSRFTRLWQLKCES